MWVRLMTPDNLLSSIVEALVDHPTEVRVDKVETPQTVTLTLVVHPDDLEKILGTSVGISDSLRDILRAAGGKVQKRIDLVIQDPRPKPQQRVIEITKDTSRTTYTTKRR